MHPIKAHSELGILPNATASMTKEDYSAEDFRAMMKELVRELGRERTIASVQVLMGNFSDHSAPSTEEYRLIRDGTAKIIEEQFGNKHRLVPDLLSALRAESPPDMPEWYAQPIRYSWAAALEKYGLETGVLSSGYVRLFPST